MSTTIVIGGKNIKSINTGNITLYTIYNLNQILPYIPLENRGFR